MKRRLGWAAVCVSVALVVTLPAIATAGTTITGTVTATPTYAVNVDSGASLDYGSRAAGATNVQPTGLTQTVISNTGNADEKITITGGDATPGGGGTSWTPVALAPAANEYRWRFVEGVTDVAVISSASTLVASLAPAGTKTYDTYLDMPTSYTTPAVFTFSATVAATAP
ncbi:MAG: hypothetical protein HY876_08400 [Coriobacteriales bacterium]|nr:hypothetical protein [Coriobacteriales bacterium]